MNEGELHSSADSVCMCVRVCACVGTDTGESFDKRMLGTGFVPLCGWVDVCVCMCICVAAGWG